MIFMTFTIARFTTRIAPALSQRLGVDPAGRPIKPGGDYPSPIDPGVQDTLPMSGNWLYVTRMSVADVDVVINSRVVGEPLKFVRLRAGLVITADFADLRLVGIYHAGLLDIQYGTGLCPFNDIITPAPAVGKDIGMTLLARGLTTSNNPGVFVYSPVTPAHHPLKVAGDVVSIAGYLVSMPAVVPFMSLVAGRQDPTNNGWLDQRPLLTFTNTGNGVVGVPCSTNEPVRLHLDDVLFWVGWSTGLVNVPALTGLIRASLRGYDEIQL